MIGKTITNTLSNTEKQKHGTMSSKSFEIPKGYIYSDLTPEEAHAVFELLGPEALFTRYHVIVCKPWLRLPEQPRKQSKIGSFYTNCETFTH